MESEDWLTLSALEHHAYCRWQAWLLQDGVWADNHLTVQGIAAHEHVDLPGMDARRGVRIHRRVPLASQHLRLHGFADAVEVAGDASVMPVEHKWGRGAGDLGPMLIQVTAQAMCLEEMLDVDVPSVAIYLVSEHRREVVATADWRAATLAAVESARSDLTSSALPAPVYAARRCRGCSILEACQPRRQGD